MAAAVEGRLSPAEVVGKQQPFVTSLALKDVAALKRRPLLSTASLVGKTEVNVLTIPRFGGSALLVPTVMAEPTPRFFADLRFVYARRSLDPSAVTTSVVLQSPRVRVAALSVDQKPESAAPFVDAIQTKFSDLVARIGGWLLFKAFRRLFSHIFIEKSQIGRLQQIKQSGVPIVYLPLHRSHMDYLLISWSLWLSDLRMPHIAAGDNLNLSGFAWVLRRLGAFFIRRRLDNGAATRDVVYRAVLHSYIEQLLVSAESLLFFAEGTRSRSGKALAPKTGLLSVVVETLVAGRVGDALLVPVSVTYEKVLEGEFVCEAMGTPKRTESAGRVLASIWRAIGRQYGRVKVNFGAPVSLKQLMSRVGDSPPPPVAVDAAQLSPAGPFGVSGGCCSFASVATVADVRPLVCAVCRQLVCEAEAGASLSATQLVSAVMLTLFRRGGRSSEVCVAFEWLLGVCARSRIDVVGCSAADTALIQLDVRRTVDLLDDHVSQYADETDSGIGEECVAAGGAHVAPAAGRAHLLALAYYRNGVLSRFRLHAVVAAVLTCNRDGGRLVQVEVMRQSRRLLSLLAFEFCTAPDESGALEAVVDDWVRRGVVERHSPPPADQDDAAEPLFALSDDEFIDTADSLLRLRLSDDEGLAELRFFALLVAPVVECYALLFDWLLSLTDPSFTEKQALSTLLAYDASNLQFEESLNTDSLRNGLKLLTDRKIIRPLAAETGVQLLLSDKQTLTSVAKSLSPLVKTSSSR